VQRSRRVEATASGLAYTRRAQTLTCYRRRR
jgi:hypothetical protein